MSAHLLAPLGLGGVLGSTLVVLSLVAGPVGGVVELEPSRTAAAPVASPVAPAPAPVAPQPTRESQEVPVVEEVAIVEESMPAAGPAAEVVVVPPLEARPVGDIASEELSRLPGSTGVTISLDPPELGDHLGTVDLHHPDEVMVNTRRLAGDEARTRDVVRHEMGHVYQGRLGLAYGFEPLESALMSAFGGDADTALERSADCVAVHFGATWTHHTSDCSAPDKVAAVQALVEARMP